LELNSELETLFLRAEMQLERLRMAVEQLKQELAKDKDDVKVKLWSNSDDMKFNWQGECVNAIPTTSGFYNVGLVSKISYNDSCCCCGIRINDDNRTYTDLCRYCFEHE
jgi:hypothetical protein